MRDEMQKKCVHIKNVYADDLDGGVCSFSFIDTLTHTHRIIQQLYA